MRKAPGAPPPDEERGTLTQKRKEIVVSREDAVFWMDGNGRWKNRAGRFEKKRIIDHFNAAIERDEGGYFVGQTRGEIREKVYFRYEDTALLVFDLKRCGAQLELVLNTGRRLYLAPARLWIENDSLYLEDAEERIRFSDRALLKISRFMEEAEGELRLRMGDDVFPIRDKGDGGR